MSRWPLILFLLVFILLTSCNEEARDITPGVVKSLKRPVVVVAVSDDGVILRGDDGEIVTISGVWRFTSIVKNSGYQAGDTLLSN